ncbi:MAG: hypothetical protein IKY52_08555, partial [Clostridia bacterium]|nr:hypothetical protein [Clostridia bacterium]
LTAKYSDGTTKTISSGFSCSPTKLNMNGSQKVTVTYEEKTTEFTVNVQNIKKAVDIIVKESPQYYVGELIHNIRIPVDILYSDGSSSSKYLTCNYNMIAVYKPGNFDVTISWEGITKNITLEAKSCDLNQQLFRAVDVWLSGDYGENGFGKNSYGDLVDWTLRFSFTYSPKYESQTKIVSCSWQTNNLSESYEKRWENAKNGKTQYLSGPGYQGDYDVLDSYSFTIYLPDDPSLEGKQSVTINVGGESKTFYFTLMYAGNYETGTGWVVSNISY